ncbi:MAG: F0F1 ATP synthase subunit delta [Betaproteobacteria bacterium]|nr:F0F1 ATP synthase subunit delta [Betaproteobacteria bacterium]
MAELTTIARPYAEAVFELARQESQLGPWSEALKFAAAVAGDGSMKAMLSSPRVTHEQKLSLLLSTAGSNMSETGKNLLRLLLKNGRAELLPEISKLYDELKERDEGVVEADVASAFPLTDDQLKALTAKLEGRFKSKVVARATVDPALIGGAVIRVGDEVLDGSVRGKLDALAAALTK